MAREVLAEQGFPRTTIREIAERANVNPALLHYYFGNRAGLHTAVVEEIGKQIRASVESSLRSLGGPRERMRALLRVYLTVLASEPYVAQMLIHHLLLSDREHPDAFVAQIGKPLVDGLRGVLEEGITSGAFREFDVNFLITSIAANSLGLFLAEPLLTRSAGGGSGSRGLLESWADSVADVVLNGIASRDS